MHPPVKFHEYIHYGLGHMVHSTNGWTKTKWPFAIFRIGWSINNVDLADLQNFCIDRLLFLPKINNNTPQLKQPKNQNRRAALGRPAITLLKEGGGGTEELKRVCGLFFLP